MSEALHKPRTAAQHTCCCYNLHDHSIFTNCCFAVCRGLIQATLHLVNREFDALADDFVTLGLLPPGSDKTEITPALTGVFQDALANGVNNLNFGDLSGSLGQTMYQYNFRIPPYYTLLVRSLSVLEVSPCYTLTSRAVFAEPMYTWPQNRACALLLLSTHHICHHSHCHHHHRMFSTRGFCIRADKIKYTHFQVIPQGSLIHITLVLSLKAMPRVIVFSLL